MVQQEGGEKQGGWAWGWFGEPSRLQGVGCPQGSGTGLGVVRTGDKRPGGSEPGKGGVWGAGSLDWLVRLGKPGSQVSSLLSPGIPGPAVPSVRVDKAQVSKHQDHREVPNLRFDPDGFGSSAPSSRPSGTLAACAPRVSDKRLCFMGSPPLLVCLASCKLSRHPQQPGGQLRQV